MIHAGIFGVTTAVFWGSPYGSPSSPLVLRVGYPLSRLLSRAPLSHALPRDIFGSSPQSDPAREQTWGICVPTLKDSYRPFAARDERVPLLEDARGRDAGALSS